LDEVVEENWGRTNKTHIQDCDRITEFGVSIEISPSKSVDNIEFVCMLASDDAHS
jgi:hypothetical protein